MKKERGITLIALVITIIVLLILAGVTIFLTMGDNGIINYAKNAGNIYQQAQANEINDLNTIEEEIDNIINEKNSIKEVTLVINNVKGMSFDIMAMASLDKSNIVKYEYFVNNESKEVNTTENTLNVNVNKLSINTEYIVYVIATDSNGMIKKSNEVKIKTLDRIDIIKPGDLCVDITGNWTNYINADIQYSWIGMTTEYYGVSAAGAYGYVATCTNEKIDLTSINTIEMDVYLFNNYGALTNTTYVGITDKTNGNIEFIKGVNHSTSTSERVKLVLDVSDKKGEYYIKIINQHGSTPKNYNTYAYVYSIIGK